MKILSKSTLSIEQEPADTTSSIHVCMHVLGAARTDERVLREARMLAQHGYTVSVVDIEGSSCQRRKQKLDTVFLDHIVMSDAFIKTRFMRWSFIRAFQLLVRGTLSLVRTPAAIYHAHDVNALPACYLAACLRRKSLVFDSHELPLSEMTISWPRLHMLLFRLLLHIVPRCAGVITVSSPIAQEIQDRYHASEVTLIRNVPAYRAVPRTDKLRQALHLNEETRIVLYQGYLQAGRGLDTLVHAAKFFEPNTVLVIMGQNVGTTKSQLEALIAEEGVDERIKIIPPVPYAELLEWTASADVGLIVYPPDYSLNVQWCLPNKFFEYLMAGLPILASPLDAVSAIIKTYSVGRVITSLEPANIGASINAMLANADTLATMRRNALAAVQEEFCWEKEGQKLVQLYNAIDKA